MQITAEYLIELRKRVDEQRANMIAQVNHAVGFIDAINLQLAHLDKPEPVPAETTN